MILEIICAFSFVSALYNDYRLTQTQKQLRQFPFKKMSKTVQQALDTTDFDKELQTILKAEGIQQIKERLDIGYYDRLATAIVENRVKHSEIMNHEKLLINKPWSSSKHPSPKNYIELI